MLFAGQLFWIPRVLDIGERFIPGKPRRAWLAVIATVVYVFFFAFNFAIFDNRPRGGDSTHLMLRHVARISWLGGSTFQPSLPRATHGRQKLVSTKLVSTKLVLNHIESVPMKPQ